ncbi:MAG TPA: NHL repeat-containing protein [Bryobacteraceae bacterium]|jgi:sugar lactone lactonase YvrE|nr:NHL repeat-containing protein [Bryobacteraceae bacterium]
MKSLKTFFLAVCCTLLPCQAALAGTLYSNIGAGFPSGSTVIYSTGSAFLGTTFTTTAGGNLSTLEIELKGKSPLTVGLYTDSAGQPGTLLESWNAIVPSGVGFNPIPTPTFLISLTHPLLTAATAYWIVLTQSSQSQVIWYSNDQNIAGGAWNNIGGGITDLIQFAADLPAPGIQLISGPPASVYITDSQNNRIRKIDASGIITTVAGNGAGMYGGDGGLATNAELHSPSGVALDGSGNLYIADTLNNRIRKVSTVGVIATVAGNGLPSYSGDGGPATLAGLNSPTGVALDSAGNLYIADERNNRIRKVNMAGAISTVAGNGTVGSGGDGGLAVNAEFYYPVGVAVDGSGDIYVADSGNQRIRKINSSGLVSTIAGNGVVGYSCANGAATAVGLHNPTGVALDGAGNLYIADYGNQCVREVSSGNLTTVAGDGLASYGGDGGPATSAALNYPTGAAVDSSGNLFIADYVNNRIREVNSGIITTVAGNGAAGFSGDGGPGTGATLYNPNGIAVSPAAVPVAGP